MTRGLSHRGPDAEGLLSWDSGTFGHRRLAIIDPGSSTQPMADGDDGPVLTYNGELYNYRHLRDELRTMGHHFRTAGDTEVVLRSYIQWGIACCERFRGMFAFAIYDRRKRLALLVRDHFGIKPLSWMAEGDCLRFSSESGPLLDGIAHPELDPAAIDRYLELGYLPSPLSACRQIHRLPPGHRLVVEAGCTAPRCERYWRPPPPQPRARPAAEIQEEFRAVVSDSVRAHLVADVPFGCFLSGGLDSLLVASRMRESLGPGIRTFTIGFDADGFDERAVAAAAARGLETEHHEELTQPDALDLLDQVIAAQGEPIGDSSLIPTWQVSRLARARIPMVLSGDGGDEIFAGYSAYAAWWRWLEMPRSRQIARSLLSRLHPGRWPPRAEVVANWTRHISVFSSAERRALWRPELRPPSLPAEDAEYFWPGFRAADAWRLPGIIDAQRYLPDDILCKVDTASMAHSLEVRTPLVDVEVARFAATLPEEALRRRDVNGAWVGKACLRDLLAPDFPDAVRRPKQGFAVPIDRWLTGERKQTIHRRMIGPGGPLLRWFRPEGLASLLERRRAGDLWPLYALDAWLRGRGRLLR